MSTIIKVRTGEEAQNLAQAVQNGVPQEDGSFIPLTPEQKTAAMAGLRQYAAERKQVSDHVESQRDPDTGELPERPDLMVIDPTVDDNGDVIQESLASDVLRRTGGAMQVGLTFGTGVVAEPLAGIAGLMHIGDPDRAAQVVASVQDALTFEPRTETGKDMLNGVAAPLSKIEEGADWIASNVSMGNPYAATAIKTTLLGGVELLGMKGAGRVRIPQKLRDIQNAAKELGIELDANNMQSSLLEAAQRMTPDQRAANAGFLQEAMRQAAEASKQLVDQKFTDARAGRAFVETREVRTLAKQMEQALLEEGFTFNSPGMETIGARLDALANIATERPGLRTQPKNQTPRITQQVKDVELIRRQLVQDARSGTPSARTAANKMKGMMDDWMDHQLANDLISGNPAVIQMWKDARLAHTDYMRDFKADRAIKNLIEQEATPQQVRAWVVGMSAIGARANAAVTVRRMQDILGKNHPAIEGIRQDMLFEVAAPLLTAKPNYSQFVANYDKLMSQHGGRGGIVEALGLNETSMKQLRDFALTAEKTNPNNTILNTELLARGLATYFVGHQLARKALKVNFVRNVGSLIFGVNRVTKRGILADLTNSIHGQPIAPRGSAAAGAFIAANALSFAEDVVDKDRQQIAEANKAAAKAREGQNPLL